MTLNSNEEKKCTAERKAGKGGGGEGGRKKACNSLKKVHTVL